MSSKCLRIRQAPLLGSTPERMKVVYHWVRISHATMVCFRTGNSCSRFR
ncbi:Uncharacterised protein [Burkholderia pseudomallei]|nr:Uncharacterised protein [Burkholderia pseudomallei]CPG55764.1 Uncharacterised protein [Burkholderia pseudomallei]